MFQVALPVALFASSNIILILKGGTNAEMAPPVSFFFTGVYSSGVLFRAIFLVF